ncbi:MAG: hypothetical protein SH818_02795 [Saprospiraceae bacterium]|nr:hypothetical protein [Saprospiraceae bacterium]
MKTNFLMGLAALCLILATSCEKSTDNASFAPDTTLNAVAVTTIETQDALISVEDLENELLESRDNGTCPSISSTAPKGTFPNTLTIDFGSGCLTKSGRYHQGKIIIEQSDSMNHAGATRITSFVEFYVDSIVVKNGTVILTNLGNDASGNKQFSRKLTNMSFTNNKGTLVINANHTRTQIAGGTTELKSDDVWEIDGESSGTVDNEIRFTTLITESLVKKGNCPYIVAGTEEVMRNDRNVTIDFGNGVCDRLAKGTMENGNSFVIVLRPRF